MTTVVLIRHGRSTANAEGILAGRMSGVALDEYGQRQARDLQPMLRQANIAAAYTSPIQRCVETARLAGFPLAEQVPGLSECDYGVWTGVALRDLTVEAMWHDVQTTPSAVSFPEGEALREMSQRVVAAVAGLVERHGPDDSIVVFSHGDPIKAVLAHALAMDFDEFQRLHVNPASVSIVRYGSAKPTVACVNAAASADLLHPLPEHRLGGGDSPQGR